MLAATALFLAGKQYRGLILLGLLVWLASPILLPESVNERFSNTLHQIRRPNRQPRRKLPRRRVSMPGGTGGTDSLSSTRSGERDREYSLHGG